MHISKILFIYESRVFRFHASEPPRSILLNAESDSKHLEILSKTKQQRLQLDSINNIVVCMLWLLNDYYEQYWSCWYFRDEILFTLEIMA